MSDTFAGIPEIDIQYPLLVSLFGETKMGKTRFASSFPNAVVLDFPPARFGFGKVEVEQVALNRKYGEGFRSIFRPVAKDGTVRYYPQIDNFDPDKQYYFVRTHDEMQAALDKTKFWADELAEKQEKVWVVIDDSYRWRAQEVLHFIANSAKHRYPAQMEFGQITQAMQSQITQIQNFANVLVVHRLANDFNTGLPTPTVYPTNCDYNADASLEIKIRPGLDPKQQERVIIVHSDGFADTLDPDFQKELPATPMDVLAALRIPSGLW
jgi:hypothetical protein